MDVKILVNPPDGVSPSAWLEHYDSNPTLLPQWPKSKQMVLVCVRAIDKNPDNLESFVILSPEQLRDASHPSKGFTRLFFKIPRACLLKDPDICLGLTAESFWSEDP